MKYFPLLYAGTIEYYSLLIRNKCTIELAENFRKQTYRNRCVIYGANGMLSLIIPIQHKGKKVPISEVCISNDENWQKRHWKSLKSAYQTSPFFEFYEDDLKPYYENSYKYLSDFNQNIFNEIKGILNLQLDVKYSTTYEENICLEQDYRNYFDKKYNTSDWNYAEYIQVFGYKHGFMPNLSIFDLIFNLGPKSIQYLNSL